MASVAEAEAKLREAAIELESARSKAAALTALPSSTEETLSNALAAIDVASKVERRNPHDNDALVNALRGAVEALVALARDKGAQSPETPSGASDSATGGNE